MKRIFGIVEMWMYKISQYEAGCSGANGEAAGISEINVGLLTRHACAEATH